MSFHRNAAANPSANGVETFVFTINNSKSMPLATAIQKALVEIGFRNRGVKTANFHVLRETYSPAVLLEVGFISNTSDNMLFDSRFENIAKAIAGAIIGAVGKGSASAVKRCSACGQMIK
ncbi:N-acetylmuramoyl-L-alanine amidase [Lysinibacillus antri]|uniref:N-acetylmuramoyl-L-alanine amidase n=1 Tax=Lysinibacillus antri TaxID=2498145 RepID=UPI001FE9E007|nr:N-acetylmuramoyl-L-alanine amidase [Lysinibacillus antri]